MRNDSGSISTRFATASALIALFILFVWLPAFRLPFALLVAMFAAGGLREYYRIARAAGSAPQALAGITAGAVVALTGCAHDGRWTAVALCVAATVVAAAHLARGRQSVGDLAVSVFGVVYVGWAAGHVNLLHGIPRFGPGLVTLLIVVVAITDGGAYLVGSAIGRHKMTPVISPNKSWEGAAGGFACALASVIALGLLSRHPAWAEFPDWTLARYLATGALLSVLGQFGDLVESWLKRAAGVKDSGSIFPGHGGILDRCDGYLFAAPVLYYLVVFFGA